jgi:hypothetical protein
MSGILQGLLASIGQSKIFAGGLGGVDFVVQQLGFFTNTSANISHPAVGYKGTLKIFMCGLPSQTNFNFDGSAGDGSNGTGQMAEFTYTCLGDETSFTLRQENINTRGSERLDLIVNGGLNNGKFVRVGSGRSNATAYGHGGAAANLVSQSTLPGVMNRAGASRPGNSTLYYSDDTSYAPDTLSSYGNTSLSYTIKGDASALIVGYASVAHRSASMRYRPTAGSSYTNYGTLTGSNTVSGGRDTTAAGASACILVFKND